MITTVPVHCPYCGAIVEHTVDPAGGTVQRYVEDCEVCCRPWSMEVVLDGLGLDRPQVSVSTQDD